MVFSTKVMKPLLGANKNKDSMINKSLPILCFGAQNICLQQACEQTGLYAHSKEILNTFKTFSIKEIEHSFEQISFSILRESICKLNLRQLKLAVDITEEPYYGKLNNPLIWSQTPKSPPGATGCFKYLTISCTNDNCKLILANIFIQPGYKVEELVPPILERIKQIIPIKQVTFDRGFHSNRLIYKLEQMKIKYLIFCQKKHWSKKILETMNEGELVSITKQLVIDKDKSKHRFNANFTLVKSFQFEKTEQAYDWVFVTNMSFKSVRHTIASYRNRWGIETVFRVLKQEFRIKTASKHQSVRLMCMCFSMIFYNLWKIAKYFINVHIKAKTFFETLRFGFKTKFGLKSKYQDEILDFFNLN